MNSIQIFNMKIHASFAADAFCRLHNDKYTKYSPHKNCVFRAYIANSHFLGICDTNLKQPIL